MRRSRRRTPPITAALSILAALAVILAIGSPLASASTKKKHRRPTMAATLTGTWNGQYSGAFNGTFVLKWTQSGTKLSGTIKISSPSSTLGVNGTISGSSISFGTVGGGTAITYTGTFSSSSMSGSFKTPAGGGSWSASKT